MSEAAKEEPKQEEQPKQEEAPKQEEEKKEDKDKNEVEEGNWLALESNPGPLNKFAARMGLPGEFAFCDVYGLDPELLQFVPQPVLAVMLLFPSSKGIKEYKMKQQQELTENPQKINKDLFYLYQHDNIGNACGTIAMIHALSNNAIAKNFNLKESALTKFMDKTAKMDWTERGWELLKAKDIQEGSEAAANDTEENQTKAPSKDDKVNAHFITFIRKEGELYELDGRKKFPVSHGKTGGASFLNDVAKVVKDKFMAQDPNNVNFNLMALASKQQ
eukprot:75459_1